jgi:hypothetical protein
MQTVALFRSEGPCEIERCEETSSAYQLGPSQWLADLLLLLLDQRALEGLGH